MENRFIGIARRTAFAVVALFMSYAVLALPLTAQVTQDTTEGVTTDTDETDVVQALSEEGEYSKLIDALQRTGLDQALAEEESFTLFAPTDDAFEDRQTSLDEMSEQEASELLRYHVVFEEVTSQQLAQMNQVTMGNGEMVEVGQNGSTIAGANVVAPDIRTQNGVIHGIDEMLEPTQVGAE